ncbi:hypothetical protein CD351_06330 [Erythrobacter sp. KY5]|uniref:hypothetical protein n=1 Tax=Erythrobacter sp. KY5 TaxID=2011159 RepID=UPI000DBF28EB|nr:hypothetical protein [Erythrobacter sp. KY5]AWW74043.1 hypothetical protein CD351_06330 [Erythrobacter sp. KY5]
MVDTMSSLAEGNQARRDRIATLLRRYPEKREDKLFELITSSGAQGRAVTNGKREGDIALHRGPTGPRNHRHLCDRHHFSCRTLLMRLHKIVGIKPVTHMRNSLQQFSAAQVCISAFYIWAGFFAANVCGQVFFGQTQFERLLVLLAGVAALIALFRVWVIQDGTREHPVNLVLFAVAALVAIDVAASITA